ncbi:MAG: peptidoglycan bridge formation glycyltransferase FemA/FemB family protein, partial [Bacteriovorax sp.]|nr:peptidoglycan bridge formation glycyltransferase FemA/FemB family protein [Bacteriovorax sp.]
MVTWTVFNGNETEWNEKLISLPFFSIYQSFQWGEIKKEDGWNVIRLIRLGHSTCTAQILYKRLPLKGAFFWCPGGILGENLDLDFNLLKKELGLLFFYFRCSFHQPDLKLEKIFSLGWKKPSYNLNSNQSMSIKIDVPEDEILKGMSSNWRHNVKRFDKKEIEVSRWLNPEPEALYEYYKKFESFKGISRQHTLDSIKGVVDKFKDNLVILRSLDSEGNLLALRGYVYLGDRALDWYAISTEGGRACYASHGILWRIFQDAKVRGVAVYDLSGVDPENNPGVYNFKKGTGAE